MDNGRVKAGVLLVARVPAGSVLTDRVIGEVGGDARERRRLGGGSRVDQSVLGCCSCESCREARLVAGAEAEAAAMAAAEAAAAEAAMLAKAPKALPPPGEAEPAEEQQQQQEGELCLPEAEVAPEVDYTAAIYGMHIPMRYVLYMHTVSYSIWRWREGLTTPVPPRSIPRVRAAAQWPE